MNDMKKIILKPTIEAILAILHMENCKVNDTVSKSVSDKH